MSIAVLGLGRVGLTTAAILAEQGHEVVGVDTNAGRVSALANHEALYDEPELLGLAWKLHENGNLLFCHYDGVIQGVWDYDALFICVGTPALKDGRTDLSQIQAVANQLAGLDYKGCVIIRSTLPVGTTRQFAEWAKLQLSQVAHFPEFLREGRAYEDACEQQPYIFGTLTEQSRALHWLRTIWCGQDTPHLTMAAESSELLKYAKNAWLAMSVSFANLMAELAEKTGAEYAAVEEALRYDERIGEFAYLTAGLGYGGPCLPKDLGSLVEQCADKDVPSFLLKAVKWTNEHQIGRYVHKIAVALGDLKDKHILIDSTAFKPDCQDCADSPAEHLALALMERGVAISVGKPQPDQGYDLAIEAGPPVKAYKPDGSVAF